LLPAGPAAFPYGNLLDPERGTCSTQINEINTGNEQNDNGHNQVQHITDDIFTFSIEVHPIEAIQEEPGIKISLKVFLHVLVNGFIHFHQITALLQFEVIVVHGPPIAIEGVSHFLQDMKTQQGIKLVT